MLMQLSPVRLSFVVVSVLRMRDALLNMYVTGCPRRCEHTYLSVLLHLGLVDGSYQ